MLAQNEWRLVLWGVLAIVACPPARAAGQEALQAPVKPRVRYWERQWSFDQLDVENLTRRLRSIGLDVPVALQGKVSAEIRVGVPWNALTTASAWRFDGSLTSAALSINDFQLRSVAIGMRYREGVLHLDKFHVRVPSPEGRQAAENFVQGTAAMELVPRGDLTASLEVSRFPLAIFRDYFPELTPMGGRLSGSLTAQVNVDELRNVEAWQVRGPVRLEELTVRGSRPATAAVQLQLADGIVTGRDFNLRVGSNRLAANARLGIVGEQAWSASVTLAAGRLAELGELVDRFLEGDDLQRLARQIGSGAFRGTAQLQGTLTPLTGNVSGHGQLRDLHFQVPNELKQLVPLRPPSVEQLDFDFKLNREALEVSEIVARLADGGVTGELFVPLEEGRFTADLQWSGLEIAEILDEPVRGGGTTAGRLTLAVPSDGLTDLSRWRLKARFTISEIQHADWTLRRVRSGDVSWSDGRLRVPNLSARFDGEPVRLDLDTWLQAPWTFEARFALPRLRLKWLTVFPQLQAIRHRLGGRLSVSGVLSGVWKPLQLRGSGQVLGRGLTFDEQTLNEIAFDYTLNRKSAEITRLRARLLGGRAGGSATLRFEGWGVSTRLDWAGINLATVAQSLGAPAFEGARGGSNGSITLTVPPGAWEQREKWFASATMQLEKLELFDWQIRQIEPIAMQLKDGRIEVPPFSAQLNGEHLQAAVSIGIRPPWRFRGDIALRQGRIARLSSLPALQGLENRISGQAGFTAELQGTLDPLRLTSDGSVRSDRLRFDGYHFDHLRFDYALRQKTLAIKSLVAKLYDGRLAGQMLVPLAAEDTSGWASFSWSEVEAGRLAGEFVELPVNLASRTSGSVDVRVPAGRWEQLREWQVGAKVNLHDMAVDGVPVGSVRLNLVQRDGRLRYAASGSLLEGDLRLEGTRPTDGPTSGLAALGTAKMRLEKASISDDAAPAFLAPSVAAELADKTFDLNLSTRATADDWSWRGAVRLTDDVLGGTRASSAFRAQLSGTDEVMRLESLSGNLGGGQLRGSGTWAFARRRPPEFQIGLRRARLQQLTALLDVPFNTRLDGPVDLVLNIRPGGVWRISGAAAAGQGNFNGVRFRNARLPFVVDWDPDTNRTRISLTSGSSTLAGGRITGRLAARREIGWTLDGTYRFYRVDVASLFRELGSRTSYGQGRVTGTLTLRGRNVRSARDLHARLVADLEDTRALSAPLLNEIQRYAPGLSSSRATRFDEGRLEARLTGGVLHLERLSLANQQVQIYVDGRMNLSGRLRLEAVVATGSSESTALANSLLAQLVAVPAAPVALLRSANDFLSNRVVYLEIRGTVRRPVIRPRPFQSLPEEALRFFLRRATGGVLGAAVTQPVR